MRILALAVVVTLAGTAATLLLLRTLLAPVGLTSSALKAYLDDRTIPELPIGFTDEAGRLMADVRYAIDHLDSTIRSLEDLSGTDTTSPACPTAERARGAWKGIWREPGAAGSGSRRAWRTSTASKQ